MLSCDRFYNCEQTVNFWILKEFFILSFYYGITEKSWYGELLISSAVQIYHFKGGELMSEIVIDAKDLTKQYKKQKAVDSATFQIRKGMICGLVGPNGAGKTTIMKMLGGLVLPTSGTYSIFGGKTEDELAKARSRMKSSKWSDYRMQGKRALLSSRSV